MVEFSLSKYLEEESEIEPDYVIGTSMGVCVFGNLRCGGCEVCLSSLIDQAKLIEQNCTQGGMLEVIASPKLYDEIPFINENSELTAVNYDQHFVLAGDRESLMKIANNLTE
ncbi:hypothetical protein [Bacillus velezensis]|uniref:hypothetical protein n=2 Tax=Bacillus velezensis TaxID=492670 RepID=UPI001C713936|nr:hypothetical protein [Bacillus velezensis]